MKMQFYFLRVAQSHYFKTSLQKELMICSTRYVSEAASKIIMPKNMEYQPHICTTKFFFFCARCGDKIKQPKVSKNLLKWNIDLSIYQSLYQPIFMLEYLYSHFSYLLFLYILHPYVLLCNYPVNTDAQYNIKLSTNIKNKLLSQFLFNSLRAHTWDATTHVN